MRCFKQFFLLSIAFLYAFTSSAQERKVVQFSGIIQTLGTAETVAYVNIRNGSFQNKMYVSNYQGYFSFVAHEGDSIFFSSVGFEKLTYVIPKTPSDQVSAMIKMNNLIHELPMVTPFPWASIEEFNIAFMELGMKDDNIMRAERNLSAESLAAMARVTPRSADEIQNYNSHQQHIRMNNRYMNANGTNQLFNPLAWGALIQQISKGNESRKK
ncbi:hypothetical protein J5U18_08100 [Sphingobacteriaceae bacterium WQ 2009]|uniref:CarboxypepD_reg-like domain-containing protein n=1 Tax=Rhinopithecimicrobium faecis TaxID=2820698 RepID=A0A8T4HB78_9SPHI|nr:hypothetical protein [Sphingobacteriaceae bacterium WQ 2009]